MVNKPKLIVTVDTEAFSMRAPDKFIDTLVYGRIDGEEWGIGRMMDIADKYGVKMTFFLDFAEMEYYGDEIINVGKYIVCRGHDLQIHCHADCFIETVNKKFPHIHKRYPDWYEDDEISDFMVEYCLEQYHKCTDKAPIIFRGGAYRFGTAFLRKLKERGVAADASYNCLRPNPLPITKQFAFENGILELPISVLPGKSPVHTLNFNLELLYPTVKGDIELILRLYENFLGDFYKYYGADAVSSLVMHSWSFCYDAKRYQTKGFLDRPNRHAAELFERFLALFCNKIDFITASQAVQLENGYFSKKMGFSEVSSLYSVMESWKLKNLAGQIRETAAGRQIVVWGKGLIENKIVETQDIFTLLGVKFYISQDAESNRNWRGRPVVTFEESEITPEKHYVILCTQLIFSDIREKLKRAGFLENCDYCDVLKSGSWPKAKTY
jgi:hypothetical protein